MPKWQNCLVCKLYFNKAIFLIVFKVPMVWASHSWGFYSQFWHKVQPGTWCITCFHQVVMVI